MKASEWQTKQMNKKGDIRVRNTPIPRCQMQIFFFYHIMNNVSRTMSNLWRRGAIHFRVALIRSCQMACRDPVYHRDGQHGRLLSIARHSWIRTPPDGINHLKPVITPHKYDPAVRQSPHPYLAVPSLIDFKHDSSNQTKPTWVSIISRKSCFLTITAQLLLFLWCVHHQHLVKLSWLHLEINTKFYQISSVSGASRIDAWCACIYINIKIWV